VDETPASYRAIAASKHDYAYAGPCPSAVVITKLTNLAHRNYVMVLLLCTVRHSDFAYVFFVLCSFVASNKYYIHTYIYTYIHRLHTYIKVDKTSADYDATATQRVAIC